MAVYGGQLLEELVADVHDLTPEEVSKGMAEGRYLLVDVRELNEIAVEAYPGAVVVPLSTSCPRMQAVIASIVQAIDAAVPGSYTEVEIL